ncbi:MAG TPA: CHASE2 domain-containing protein, partial [Abditibacteriaceae bacterium]
METPSRIQQHWRTPWYRLPLTWILLLAVVAAVGTLAQTGLLSPLEFIAHDWRFAQRGPQTSKSRIVIVEIDQASLDAPQLSAPLIFWGKHHARVIETLGEMGAKAIGFDIVQPLSLSNYANPNPDQLQAQVIAATPQLVLTTTRTLLPNGQVRETFPNELFRTASALGGG